jgi:hypothetical protein
MAKQTAWISCDIEKFDLCPEVSTPMDSAGVERPYEILKHVERLLLPSASRDDLVCAIIELRKVIRLRDKRLNKIYNFMNIPQFKKHSPNQKKLSQYDIMEAVGIIKPIMRKEIIDVRDFVDHEDKRPPNVSRCREFAEFVWYFLRSTDSLVANKKTLLLYEKYRTHNKEADEYAEFSISFRNWCIKISGQFPKKKILYNDSHNALKIISNKQITPCGIRDKLIIDGTLDPTSLSTLSFIRRYFSMAQ